MNKLVLSSLILSIFATVNVNAQEVAVFSNTNNINNTKIKTTASGVTIKMPDWSNSNSSSQNVESQAPLPNNDVANNLTTSNQVKSIDKINEDKNIKKEVSTPNQVIKDALPTQSATIDNNIPATPQKKIGQINSQVNKSYQDNISSWNKSTIEEFESKGKNNLNESYSSFLLNNAKK